MNWVTLKERLQKAEHDVEAWKTEFEEMRSLYHIVTREKDTAIADRDEYEKELTRIKTDGYVNLAAWKRTVDERDAALEKVKKWKDIAWEQESAKENALARAEIAKRDMHDAELAANAAANDWEKTARNACGGGARVGNELIDLRKRIETLASNWKKWCQGGEKYAEDLLDLLKPIKKETAWELLLRLERETYSTLLSHSATETMAKLRKALEEDNEKAK